MGQVKMFFALVILMAFCVSLNTAVVQYKDLYLLPEQRPFYRPAEHEPSKIHVTPDTRPTPKGQAAIFDAFSKAMERRSPGWGCAETCDNDIVHGIALCKSPCYLHKPCDGTCITKILENVSECRTDDRRCHKETKCISPCLLPGRP